MRKTLLISIALCASLPLAHAEPKPERASRHASAATHMGEAIHQASDHAQALVRNALQFLGVPYRRGGTSADTGFDCSGFVRTTFEQALGLMLPRRAAEQAAATYKIDKHELRPGDLVFFNTLRRAYSHVGIYLGEGRFIHAPRRGATVRVESMDTRYWRARFNGARRALQTDPPAMLTAASTRADASTPMPAAARDAATPPNPTPLLAPAAEPAGAPAFVFPAGGNI